MATSDLDTVWKEAFSERQRPEIYASQELSEDGFRPLADPLDFMTDMSKLTASQLYAQAANNQAALKQAQDEYLELERIINQLKSRDPTAMASMKNPQALPAHQDFEERKESMLYGYKYDPNRPLASYGRWHDVSEQERRDLRSDQDPFTQGGFVPNDRQYKGILNKATDKNNLDNWKPVERDGRKLIPKMAPRVNEKEEYWQLSGLLSLAKGVTSKPVTRSGTPDPDVAGIAGRDVLINKRLRNTRFNGAKVPITRDVSEAPSIPVSRASTPKRKRGDTPIITGEPNGSPVKKPKLAAVDGDSQMPLKRKHHNQYTKAKEQATKDALHSSHAKDNAEQNLKANAVLDRPMAGKVIQDDKNLNIIPESGYDTGFMILHIDDPPWSRLTDQEKRNFHWNNETLVRAVKDDPSWLNEDLKTRQKWTKKILGSKFPVRTYSMYKKWDYWRLIGEDKRPRNKKKSRGLDDLDQDMDDTSEVATNTPSPLSRHISIHDLDDEDELMRGSFTMSPGPSRLGRGELVMDDYDEVAEDTQHGVEDEEQNIGTLGSGSESASASQTISIHREEPPSAGTVFRRTTRASRKASA